MADRVAVVTDSTAGLPPDLVREHDMAVVPLHVMLGGRSGVEGRDISPEDVAAALTGVRVPVSTSRPTPEEFADVYRSVGAEAIVSIHLSAVLSGTCESALVAATQVAQEGIAVTVVDSRTIGMALGFAVLAAARCAARASSAELVAECAREAAGETDLLFYVDTLEHLRRGGRIGAAAALFGTALAIKPLLHMEKGQIAALEKVRTASRALARLEDLAVQRVGAGPVSLAVQHLGAAERAAALADRLAARLPAARDVHVSQIGAVVGAHVGPGLIGVAVARG